LELICICVQLLRPCLSPISCYSGGHQTVYRYQRNQAESCQGNSAMEIQVASASAKFRQSNRTDKWLEFTMQLFHSCLTARVGTWSPIGFMTQYAKHIHASPKVPQSPILQLFICMHLECKLFFMNYKCHIQRFCNCGTTSQIYKHLSNAI